MDAVKRLIRCGLILTMLYGLIQCSDWCTDDLDNLIYCSYGCCGWDDSYCCGDTWGSGSIAGTVVGIVFFCIFVSCIIACCRRRYRPAPAFIQTPNNASVAVIHSHTMATTSNVGPGFAGYNQQYAPPMQQPYQKPNQPNPGQYQPPPQYPGQPGVQQPPPYTQ